jgi:predicted ATPase/DNA-binding CsgD family transcriptional regulator
MEFLPKLTQREQDVLNLLAEGLSDSEIAESLVLTIGTVKWYNRQIYNKLGVPNRRHAIIQAQRLGVLSTTESLPQTQEDYKHNLPAQLTSFIGRSSELVKLRQLMQTTRLLTLSGPPGTGKTRLSLQLAADSLPRFQDGVFVVSLAPVRDPALVVKSIAQALAVTESGKTPLLDTLKQFLSSRHLLLILDNFEHVLPAAFVVSELLGAAPRLSIVVTSREILHLYGEYEFSVPPLQLPDLKQFGLLESIKHREAVELFVQRAQTVRAEFALNSDNAPAVAAICVHLDGLPLAIELAAARTRLYAPQTLLVHLGSRLQTLTDGPRDFPTRQRTLRDTLAWSYDLLDEAEKILFVRLGVFVGGCSLDDAEAVCADGLNIPVAAGLEALRNKSLLQLHHTPDGEPRWIMLETMREYALEKLAEGGEMALICEQHSRYYQTRAEQAAREYRGASEVCWLDWLEAQHDNLRAALRWSLEADETVQTSFRFIGNLAHFWEMKGHFSEGRAWLAEALALSGEGARTNARANALLAIGTITYFQCDYSAAQALCKEALAIYRELGSERSAASALIKLGVVAIEIGDYEAASRFFQQGYGIMKALDDPTGIAWALTELGFGALRVGDYNRAQQCLEEGLSGYRANNERYGASLSLSGLGEVALRKGELEKATTLLEESLSIRRDIHQKWGVAASLGSLAWVAMLQGDDEHAIKILSESLDLRIEMNDAGGIAWCLEKLAEMAHRRGEASRAVKIYGAAAALRKSVDSVIERAEQPHYNQLINDLRDELSEAVFQGAWAEGRAQTVEQIADFVARKT